MKTKAYNQWLIGQVVSVFVGASLGFAQASFSIGMAVIFLLGLLVDIRHELNLLNEK